jgi:hypothetical protein
MRIQHFAFCNQVAARVWKWAVHGRIIELRRSLLRFCPTIAAVAISAAFLLVGTFDGSAEVTNPGNHLFHGLGECIEAKFTNIQSPLLQFRRETIFALLTQPFAR